MLPHVASDKAPDHIACWTAFSGLLDNDAIESADWAAKKKKPSASSAAVYDIAMFDQLVKASELLIDYEPLGPVEPIKAAFKGKGKGPAKRKHEEINDKDEEEMDDGSDGDGSGSGSQ